MLMKTFIFNNFGHRGSVSSTLSSQIKKPTVSQHTSGILPNGWAVQGTLHCCNLGRQSNKIKKKKSSWELLLTRQNLSSNMVLSPWDFIIAGKSREMLFIETLFSTMVKDTSAEMCAASEEIYLEAQCIFCRVSDYKCSH